MNELNITNEKIRKDLTFNYNGKEYLYSYGKDTLTNNNFTLLYENNKSKDEILRIYDNNLTINEKYLDENVINKDFFEILKQNNLLDKTESYENFKSLNEKIDIYAKVGMSDISFSYNKNNFHYSMHQGKFGTSSICLNPINQIIYEKTTKDFVGTTINVIKYDSRYLNKKMFAALEFNLDFFTTLVKNKLINEKIDYNDIYDFKFQSEISQKNNNCKETPKEIILTVKDDEYQTSISTFNFNNEIYFVKQEGEESCCLYLIEKYNKNLNLIENVIEFNIDIQVDNSIKYEVFVKNEKNINDGFLEKINKEYLLDLNKNLLDSAKNIHILIDDENDKAIFEINDKKYELEKRTNEDNENKYHFTIDTIVKNENSEIIFNFHQDVNSPYGNKSKLDFNKNEFTKEIYDSIMLSSELYDLMPDVIKYSLKYEDLEIDKDDLER